MPNLALAIMLVFPSGTLAIVLAGILKRRIRAVRAR